MSNILSDLKMRLSADTADLQQNMEKAKSSVNKFSKSSGKSSSKFSKGFKNAKKSFSGFSGAITSQLDGMTGGLASMTSGAVGAIKGLKGISIGLKGVKAALISTGLGALIVALGVAIAGLISYFKNTKEGQAIFTKAINGINAVIDTLMSRLSMVGEAIVLFFEGKWGEAADKMEEALSGIGDQIQENFEKSKGVSDRETQLRKDKIKFIEEEKKKELQISELIRKAKQKDNYSEAKRLKFLEDASKKQNDISREKIRLQEEETALLIAKNKMGDNGFDDDEAEAKARAEILELKTSENTKQREIENRQREIKNQIIATGKAEQKVLEEKRKQTSELEKQLQKGLESIRVNPVVPVSADTTQLEKDILESMNKRKEDPFKLPFEMDIQEPDDEEVNKEDQDAFDKLRQKAQETKDFVQSISNELNAVLTGMLTESITSIGEMLGEALSGGNNNLKSMMDTMLMMLLDFGAQFGKILVSLGVAQLALFESLKLGPVGAIGAIAAGTAIIALAGAAKSHMSKGVGAGGSGSRSDGEGGGRSSGVTGMGAGSDIFKDNNINITGEFVQHGNDLVAVVNETNKRKLTNF